MSDADRLAFERDHGDWIEGVVDVELERREERRRRGPRQRSRRVNSPRFLAASGVCREVNHGQASRPPCPARGRPIVAAPGCRDRTCGARQPRARSGERRCHRPGERRRNTSRRPPRTSVATSRRPAGAPRHRPPISRGEKCRKTIDPSESPSDARICADPEASARVLDVVASLTERRASPNYQLLRAVRHGTDAETGVPAGIPQRQRSRSFDGARSGLTSIAARGSAILRRRREK